MELVTITNSLQSSLIPEPQHYPLDMSRFGKAPNGKNLYRVVFAPSVKMLVGGKWADGRAEYRARPAYRGIGNEWILERWISGFEWAKMSREMYELRFRDPETSLFRMGPFPIEGTYFMVGDAPLASPGDGGLEKLIGWIEKARRNDPEANRTAIQNHLAAQEKADDETALSRIKELRPAFGIRPTSFPGHVHSTKSKPVNIAAQQTGLPVGTNKIFVP